jgi:hypothetical protein
VEISDLFQWNILLTIGDERERVFGFDCAGTARRQFYMSCPVITMGGQPAWIVRDNKKLVLNIISLRDELTKDRSSFRERIKSRCYSLRGHERPFIQGEAGEVSIIKSYRLCKLLNKMTRVNESPVITAMKMTGLEPGNVTPSQLTSLKKAVNREYYFEIMNSRPGLGEIDQFTHLLSKNGVKVLK